MFPVEESHRQIRVSRESLCWGHREGGNGTQEGVSSGLGERGSSVDRGEVGRDKVEDLRHSYKIESSWLGNPLALGSEKEKGTWLRGKWGKSGAISLVHGGAGGGTILGGTWCEDHMI